MGIAFKDLIPGKEVDIKNLKGKIVVFDTYNLLYQFISSIRSRDGSLLMDSKGHVTSHLVGLFSRVSNILNYGIKPAFVFDGEVPKLKNQERQRRKEVKQEAQKKYDEALSKEDIDGMKKYAARTSRLTEDMVSDAKKLLSYLGLPIIQAPSEGEAQASYMVKKDNLFAVVSQDYDSLLYGTPNLLKNVSILGKRKQTDRLSYTTIKPEIINLSESLNNLGIDIDQLTAVAMLIGTDYNPGGIKGIGPKNAITLVKKHKKDFSTLFKEARWDDFFPYPWTDVYHTFKNMKTTDDYSLIWGQPDIAQLKSFLIDHDFSEERIDSTLEKINKKEEEKKQKSLFEF